MSLKLLRELIAIPSVNPMGRPLSGPELYEARMTEFLVDFLRSHNLEVERHEVAPGRSNVLAKLDGRPGSPVVVLDAHQDTVPVDGMTVEPFRPVIRDGRVYGRGACDVKGGMAAMLDAMVRLAADRRGDHATVVMSCTCDEELGMLGARHLVSTWSAFNGPSHILSRPPDLVIVAEPTELNVVVAHKGTLRWRIRVDGRSAHSSDPTRGINAIYRVARLVGHLEDYAERLPTAKAAHPLCGRASLSVGTIEGGLSVNTVPSACEIRIDRRLLPGESSEEAFEDAKNFLSSRLDFDFTMHSPDSIGLSLDQRLNQDVGERLLASVRHIIPDRNCVGVPYCTHAGRFAHHNVPSVVFGPGSIDQAHTQDEWIDIRQLEQASEILYHFLTQPF
jgi:acetylornithine deacetylase